MVDKLLNINNLVHELLHADENRFVAKVFIVLEKKTGISRKKLWWAFTSLLGIFLTTSFFGRFLSHAISLFYPVYASIKSIESHIPEDNMKWLTYWTVHATTNFLESYVSFITGWIPFYWLIKSGVSIWMMLPKDLNGSLFIYKHYIRPYFLKYEPAIDDVMSLKKMSVPDKVVDPEVKDDKKNSNGIQEKSEEKSSSNDKKNE